MSIRIYVACLAAYNASELHGEWIDATQEPEDIMADVKQMLANSPEIGAEEWAIHDYEFGGITISEWESFESVSQKAQFLLEHGQLGALVLNYCDCIEQATEALKDHYHGEYSSLEDYARGLIEDTVSELPEHITRYLDYERMGKDMALNGDIFTIETGYREVHVFSNF